jgi:hypothetical protein
MLSKPLVFPVYAIKFNLDSYPSIIGRSWKPHEQDKNRVYQIAQDMEWRVAWGTDQDLQALMYWNGEESQ